MKCIIYHRKTWVATPQIGRVLGGFHHRMALRITGKQPRQVRDGVWLYPLLEDAMAEAGLQEVETYVYRLQNTVRQFIATRPNMDLCLAVEKRLVPRVYNCWWENYIVDMEGVQMAAREAEQTERKEEMDRTENETD